MYILLSVKEYCKKFKVTDAAVRKNKSLNTVKHKDLTYIVIEDSSVETLKNKVKLQNANIKALKNEVQTHTKQDDIIQEQKSRIRKLEDRIESLESKLDKQIDQKEVLYEKVIGHMIEHNPRS